MSDKSCEICNEVTDTGTVCTSCRQVEQDSLVDMLKIKKSIEDLRAIPNDATIERYTAYNEFLNTHRHIPTLVHQSQMHLNALQKAFKVMKYEFRGAEYDVMIAERQLKSLRRGGMLKSLVSTKHEDKINSQEKRLSQKKELHSSVVEEFSEMQADIDETSKRYEELQALQREFNLIQTWQTNLVNEITEGHSIEGLKNLELKEEELQTKLSQLSMSFYSMKMNKKLTKQSVDNGRVDGARALVRDVRIGNLIENLFSNSSYGLDDYVQDRIANNYLTKTQMSIDAQQKEVNRTLNSINKSIRGLTPKYNEIYDKLKTVQKKIHELKVKHLSETIS